MTQEVASQQRNIIMTVRKLRRIMDAIRGKRVPEAYAMLRLMPYRAADVVLKNLVAASHNAEVKYNVTPDRLRISEALADDGKIMVRYKPRAQGRIYRREKRTSRLTLRVQVVEPVAAK
ncbi:MAG: 50S ribosomal protein L22 [Vampirovibrionales bacterium]|nr:50S ribosomal protein L22 [Vampirovibrionales bacterium]